MDSLSYQQTLDYLFEKLPMFSRIGKAALKPDLTNTLKLCEALGNPQTRCRYIHIAGTNGKGSTSHGLAAVLQHAGYKTGLYTSPHLIDFRERIRIDGIPVSEQWVADFVNKYKNLIEEIKPSFFEITVAMAFQVFAEEKVDIVVLETGLGGRLDSTNIITPILSVITNISYDHKDLLGNTLAEIAAEKAGIIKPGVPAVIGEQNDETERVFLEHSIHKQATLYYAESLWGIVRVNQDGRYQYFKAINNAKQQIYELKTDLQGNYQQHNVKTILTVVELLAHFGFNVTTEGAITALASVKTKTGLRGRWEWVSEEPPIVCDVAHNTAGLREVLQQFKTLFSRLQIPSPVLATGPQDIHKKHIIIGFVRDKDVEEALALFPKNAIYYFCNAKIPRALPAKDLQAIAEGKALMGNTYDSVTAAIVAASEQMQTTDALLITGSFFIVGEALEYFDREQIADKARESQ